MDPDTAYNRNHSAHPRNLTCLSKYLNMLIPKTKNAGSQKKNPAPSHHQLFSIKYKDWPQIYVLFLKDLS